MIIVEIVFYIFAKEIDFDAMFIVQCETPLRYYTRKKPAGMIDF